MRTLGWCLSSMILVVVLASGEDDGAERGTGSDKLSHG